MADDFQIKDITSSPASAHAAPSLKTRIFFRISKKRILAFLLGAIVVLVITGLALFVMGRSAFKENKVVLEIKAPESVIAGEEFEYKIKIGNDNKVALQNIRLSVTYPTNATVFNPETGKRLTQSSEELAADALAAHDSIEVVRKAFLSGNRGDNNKLNVRLVYTPQNISSNFERKKDHTIAIAVLPIDLSLFIPRNAVVDQHISVHVNYRNDTDKVFENIRLVFDYPNEFIPDSFDPRPDLNKRVWVFEKLSPGDQGRVTIDGHFQSIGADGARFRVFVQKNVDEEYVNFESIEDSIQTVPTLVSIQTLLNGNDNTIVGPGENLRYTIRFKNISGEDMRDAILSVKLEGRMFDFSSIGTNAFIDRKNNVILWNSTILPSLATFTAGAQEEVQFTIRTVADYPITGFDSREFFLKAEAKFESPDPPEGFGLNEVVVNSTHIAKVRTRAEFTSAGYYHDPAFPINSGPIPPQSGKKTTYTIHWEIRNYSNSLVNVKISGKLASEAQWERNVKLSAGTVMPQYDERTRVLTWELSNVPAGVGILTDNVAAIMQVGFTPKAFHSGKVITLLRGVRFEAVDSFTGEAVSFTMPDVSTENIADLSKDDGVVQ